MKYRHGDITFYKVEKIEGEKVKHDGKFVLAEGETTGHKHVITIPDIMDMEVYKTKDGGYLLKVKSEAKISHEEHKTLKIAPGIYRVSKEREMDHFAGSVARKVID